MSKEPQNQMERREQEDFATTKEAAATGQPLKQIGPTQKVSGQQILDAMEGVSAEEPNVVEVVKSGDGRIHITSETVRDGKAAIESGFFLDDVVGTEAIGAAGQEMYFARLEGGHVATISEAAYEKVRDLRIEGSY